MSTSTISVIAVLLTSGLPSAAAAPAAKAELRIAIQLRPLHTDACVQNLTTALRGKVLGHTLDAERAQLLVTLSAEQPAELLTLVELLRRVGHEPLAMLAAARPGAELTLRSAGFATRPGQAELAAALAGLDFLDAKRLTFSGTDAATLPVVGDRLDVRKLLDVVGQSGFALSGVELRPPAKPAEQPPTQPATKPPTQPATKPAEKPATKPAEPPLPTQAELGSMCVILTGEQAKRATSRMFRGLLVPLCCQSCQEEWDKMSDDEKVQTLRAAAGK